MHRDIHQGKWKHIRGKVKEGWEHTADLDLDKITGKRERWVSLVQEKYGYTKEKADQHVDFVLKRLHIRPANSNPAFRILGIFAGSLVVLASLQRPSV